MLSSYLYPLYYNQVTKRVISHLVCRRQQQQECTKAGRLVLVWRAAFAVGGTHVARLAATGEIFSPNGAMWGPVERVGCWAFNILLVT